MFTNNNTGKLQRLINNAIIFNRNVKHTTNCFVQWAETYLKIWALFLKAIKCYLTQAGKNDMKGLFLSGQSKAQIYQDFFFVFYSKL